MLRLLFSYHCCRSLYFWLLFTVCCCSSLSNKKIFCFPCSQSIHIIKCTCILMFALLLCMSESCLCLLSLCIRNTKFLEEKCQRISRSLNTRRECMVRSVLFIVVLCSFCSLGISKFYRLWHYGT